MYNQQFNKKPIGIKILAIILFFKLWHYDDKSLQ